MPISIARILWIVTGLGATVTLSACSTTGNVGHPSGPQLVPSEKALIMPPPGGPAIVGVVERIRGNGIEQTVALSTSSKIPGQNYLRIHFFGAQGSAPDVPDATFRTINENDLRREIARAAPGVPMVRAATFLQNTYGPFGYASGRGQGGDTCLFAWQQIRSPSTSSGIGRGFGMIQVRLRLCDNQATARQMLNAMYGFTIVGTFKGRMWNPYGDVAEADERLGRTGEPIYPEGAFSRRSVSLGYGMSTGAPQPLPARRKAVEQVSQPETEAAAPAGPRVPLPDPGAGVSGSSSSTEATGTTVPSPDCVGTEAMTAACRK
ncbi:cellulose biosynthesis protein BcsN [Rhizobium sp. YS-1r]|uniref:cellulose biosynthesis protein BcsN n=1 Tax=Rhizobium sp. YS-1r TaxID=1532558 RepID=UPI001FCCBDEF|nr:cellulose biosynthesis protein BcsN [Rhizobium sp. YS-1r]